MLDNSDTIRSCLLFSAHTITKVIMGSLFRLIVNKLPQKSVKLNCKVSVSVNLSNVRCNRAALSLNYHIIKIIKLKMFFNHVFLNGR